MPRMPTYNMALEVSNAAQTLENRVGHLADPVLAGRDFGALTLVTLRDAMRTIESARGSMDAILRVLNAKEELEDRNVLRSPVEG
jgi:hypothetical protein